MIKGSNPHQVFVTLLRAAIGMQPTKTTLQASGMQSNEAHQIRLNPEEWQDLYSFMQLQDVTGICWKTIQTLPEEQLPPQSLQLKWVGMTNYINISNKRFLKALKGFYELLDEIHIRPIVLKGLAFAQNYPQPEMRLSSDIDVYIPHHYAEVTEFLCRKGFEIEYSDRHNKIEYQGVVFEIHPHLISRPFEEIKEYQVQTLEYNGVKFDVPDLTTQAILLLTHNAQHLAGPGVGYRQLCDWTLLLTHHATEIDVERFKSEISRQHLQVFTDVFSTVAQQELGLQLPNFITASQSHLVEQLSNDILHQGDSGYNEVKRRKNKNPFAYVGMAMKRLLKFLPYSSTIAFRILTMKIREKYLKK